MRSHVMNVWKIHNHVQLYAGYKFDDKKPDSPTLKIKFAHFPFRPPTDDGQ